MATGSSRPITISGAAAVSDSPANNVIAAAITSQNSSGLRKYPGRLPAIP